MSDVDPHPSDPITDALSVADWRRQVFALYAGVRDLSAAGGVVEAHDHWRTERDRLFRTHPASPVLDRRTFTGLPVAPYDAGWRFVVEIEPAPEQQIAVGTGTDGEVSFSRIGLARLPGIGTLDVWWHEGYGGGIFLPVRDATSGQQTYGGGRYLLDTIKGADLGSGPDARVVLDFNFAYHPSCAYNPAWACPLPQPGNTVDVAVPVGEQSGD